MLKTKEPITPTPEEEAVAKSLFRVDTQIYDFRIDWDDIGSYRRYCYYYRAREIIIDLAKFRRTGETTHAQHS